MVARAKVSELVKAVDEATKWAEEGTALALGQLARSLAREIDASEERGTAALAKELRATLESLEVMRDGDDAGAELAAVLSTPVRDSPRSRSGNAGTARRQDRGAAG